MSTCALQNISRAHRASLWSSFFPLLTVMWIQESNAGHQAWAASAFYKLSSLTSPKLWRYMIGQSCVGEQIYL